MHAAHIHHAAGRSPLLGVVIIALTLLFACCTYGRPRAILKRWAADGGYMLLSARIALFTPPALWLTTSRHQFVYYVRVLTPSGAEREGWVRCGSYWLGVLTDTADVLWKT